MPLPPLDRRLRRGAHTGAISSRPESSKRVNRREALLLGGGVAAVLAIGGGAYALLRDGAAGDSGSAAGTGAPPGAGGDAAADCALTPELTEGPFYIDEGLIRSDIRGGRTGTALELELTVQGAATCAPIEDATVEVWHADALGVYSGFDAGVGETFLRGGQRSDADGLVRFTTIYPGWYGGRAVHVHVRTHVEGDVVHVGQLFFDDATTVEAFAAEPYAQRGPPDVPNQADGIYLQGGEASTLRVSRSGGGYRGAMVLGVQI